MRKERSCRECNKAAYLMLSTKTSILRLLETPPDGSLPTGDDGQSTTGAMTGVRRGEKRGNGAGCRLRRERGGVTVEV